MESRDVFDGQLAGGLGRSSTRFKPSNLNALERIDYHNLDYD